MIVKNINSRNKGHQFERDLCKLFRKYFPKVNTSRASSKLLDAPTNVATTVGPFKICN